MNEMACPNQEQLQAYLTGKLDDDLSVALDEHLDQCPDCQALIATVDDAGDTLLSQLRGAPADDEYRRESEYHQAMAGAKALAQDAAVAAEESPSSDDDSADDLGQIGEYKLLAVLGEGGMGKVYKARQTKLRRIVALKVLSEGRIKDKGAVVRFEREMGAVGQLSHPNIVHAHDAREIDGTPILAMEYLQGLDLSELSKRAGNLRVSDACELIRQAAVGLQYAHQAGMVHRDIKPSNLMLILANGGREPSGLPTNQPAQAGRSPSAVVKILDLGLALVCNDEANGVEVTGTGQAMGTADYMAPEQAHDSHGVDIRADIYALGCTLYKLLAGQAPFSGPKYPSHNAKLIAHAHDPIPPITEHRNDLPAELTAVLDKMLAKKADDRYAAPGEVAVALVPFAAGDLPGLLAAAGHATDSSSDDKTGGSTEPFASSALVGTRPSHAPIPQPATVPPKRRWVPWVALGLVPLLILLGIVVWYKGKRYVFPDNTEVVVSEDGISVKPLNEVGKPKPGQRNETGPSDRVRDYAAATDRLLEPLEIETGDPISEVALVRHPAKIAGLKSWTIETRGHRGDATRIKASFDGRYFASGGEDGVIRVWETATGSLDRVLLAANGEIQGLEWSPRDLLLAVCSQERWFLWDVAAGRLLHQEVYSPPRDRPQSLAWSPDGARLAVSVAIREQTETWRLKPVSLEKTIVTNQSDVPAMEWLLDGKRLVHVYGYGGLSVWDVEAGENMQTATTFWAPTHSSLSPDGRSLLINRRLQGQCWRIGENQLTLAFEFRCKGCSFSPDGQTVIVGAGSGIPGRTIDLGKPKKEERLDPGIVGWPCAPPGGKYLALLSDDDGSVTVVKANSPTPRWRVAGHGHWIDAIQWARTGSSLAIGMYLYYPCSPAVRVFDPTRGEQTARLAESYKRDVRHEGLGWAPSGRVIAIPLEGNNIGIFDWRDGAIRYTVPLGHASGTVTYSPDGKVLASGTGGGVLLFDTSTNGVLQRYDFGGRTRATAFSPDGRYIAVGTDQDTRICRVDIDEVVHVLRHSDARGEVRSLAFSSDGRSLAVARKDLPPQIWSVTSGKLEEELTLLPTASRLEWLSGGRLAISPAAGGVAYWDPKSRLREDTPGPRNATLSADGRLLAGTGALGHHVEVWDAKAGRVLKSFVPLRGNGLLTLTGDGHWRVTPKDESEIIYVALTDSGEQLTLSPAEFGKRFDWNNDPTKVSLIANEADVDEQTQLKAGTALVPEKSAGPGP